MQERRRQERIETNEVAYTGWVEENIERSRDEQPSRSVDHHFSLRALVVPQLFWGTYLENCIAKRLIQRA